LGRGPELYEIQQLANLGIYQEAMVDTMENDTLAIRNGVGDSRRSSI